jgi:hypothetical protein
VGGDADEEHPDMRGPASFTQSRWVIDGGVLVNTRSAPRWTRSPRCRPSAPSGACSPTWSRIPARECRRTTTGTPCRARCRWQWTPAAGCHACSRSAASSRTLRPTTSASQSGAGRAAARSMTSSRTSSRRPHERFCTPTGACAARPPSPTSSTGCSRAAASATCANGARRRPRAAAIRSSRGVGRRRSSWSRRCAQS